MVLRRLGFIVLGWVIFLSDGLNLPSYTYDDFKLRHQRQVECGKCILPSFPKNGKWNLLNGNAKPGDTVRCPNIVQYECNPGYKLSTEHNFTACVGQWSPTQIPECDKLCPPLYSSDIYQVKCVNKLGKEVECTEASDGANLEYTCADFYETPLEYKKTLYCENGKWSDQKPVCQPICGKKINHNVQKLSYGSKPDEWIKYPWVTAIYKKKNGAYVNICGGTILSPTIIITAAHCVTDNSGNKLPKDKYLIGAGKLYNKYQAPQDKHAQYLQLSEIIIPPVYKGDIRHYLGDLAVLVLEGELSMSEVVQPACFLGMSTIHLHAGHKGELAGWGVAEGGKPSEVLRSLVIPFKYPTLCAQELPEDFANIYNLEDKICAGFVNQSISVCTGDSGNGFVFSNRDNNRYYIHGIVSLGHKNDFSCDIQQNSLYTKLSSYYKFVEDTLTKYAPKIKDCLLPPYPENGIWTADTPNRKPGDNVPSNTIITLQCNKGYRLSASRDIECSSAYSMPTCEALCPTVRFPKGTHYYCTDIHDQNIDCSLAIDGSRVRYVCPNKFTILNERTCLKGTWNISQPECSRPIPNCGKKISNDMPGTTEKNLENPWNVVIYKLDTNREEKFVISCGGSLISNRIVLTSAQCVLEDSGDVVQQDTILVGAGKAYIEYNDTRDKGAQYSNVSHISINPVIKEKEYVLPDVAILVTTSSFTYNSFVQPVCITHEDDLQWQPEFIEIMVHRKYEDDFSGKMQNLEVKKFDDCFHYNRAYTFLELLFDKTCAAFQDNSTCLLPSDSGKGVIARNPDDSRYYLFGVASIPLDNSCGVVWYTSLRRFHQQYIEYLLTLIYAKMLIPSQRTKFPINTNFLQALKAAEGTGAHP